MKAFRYWMYLRRTNFGRWIRDYCKQVARSPMQMQLCVSFGERICYRALRTNETRTQAFQVCIDELRKFVENLAAQGIRV